MVHDAFPPFPPNKNKNRTTCRFSNDSSFKSQHELLQSLFNNMAERGTNLTFKKQNIGSDPISAAQTKADTLPDSISDHSSSILNYGGLRDTAYPPNQGRPSSVDHCKAVAFILTEDSEFPPVLNHQELVPPFHKKSTNEKTLPSTPRTL